MIKIIYNYSYSFKLIFTIFNYCLHLIQSIGFILLIFRNGGILEIITNDIQHKIIADIKSSIHLLFTFSNILLSINNFDI